MEKWQEDYIKANLSKLLKLTKCSPLFLSELTSFLGDDDEESLVCESFLRGELTTIWSKTAKFKSEGHRAQTNLLYNIVTKKSTIYGTLSRALRNTKQIEAYQILLNGAKSHLHECRVKFQGQELHLRVVMKNLGKEMIERIAETFEDDDFILDVIDNKLPILVRNTVPAKINYYIPRRLTPRHHIDPAVFDKNCNDIFVIKNIKLSDLSLLAKKGGTDLSSNHTNNLTARFIVLDYELDYDRICQRSTEPVHLLEYTIRKRLMWIRSKGDISNLQQYVHNDQYDQTEEIFLSSYLRNTSPVCISDTPGMGKTELLTSLANNIMQLHPYRIVQYYVLSELVPEIEQRSNGKIDKELLINIISERASQNEFGRKIMKALLNAGSRAVELMLDGFDEVLFDQVNAANAILQTVAQLRSVRLYVTTRPHLRDELEKTLGVLGHNIQPFDTDDRVECLKKYWKQHDANALNIRLGDFARSCFNALEKKMNDPNEQIAGIPLQCKMLAEVYQDDALRYSNSGDRLASINTSVVIHGITFFDLYEKLVELRLNKASKILDKNYEDKMDVFSITHMSAAVQLLFPEFYDKLKNLFAGKRKVETRELCSWGFLEKKEADGKASLRFTHRTFAEYFIGLFVTKCLLKNLEEFGNQGPEQVVYVDFLYNTVLSTKASFDNPLGSCKIGKWDMIMSSTFTHPVICFFINAHLNKNKKHTTGKIQKILGPVKLYEVIAACIIHDYASLLPLVKEDLFSDQKCGLDNLQLSHLTLLSAKYASSASLILFLTMHQQLFTNNQKPLFLKSYSLEFLITPLHVAVARGNFYVAEFLLKNTTSMHGIWHELKYVVHCCVSGSINDDATTIGFKLVILQLISNLAISLDIDWINEALPDGTTPLLQNGVHFKLIKTLLKCKANVNAVSDHGCVLHRLIENEITPQMFHKILFSLLKYNFEKFNSTDAKNRTPLHAALAKLELGDDSIQEFDIRKADFNAKDDQGNSIFFYAVRANRSVALLETLVSHGSDFTQKNDNFDNVLHVCARHGNFSAFKYFFQLDKLNVDELNAVNKNGMTPVILALTCGKGLEVSIIKEMEKKGFPITSNLASDGLKALLCNSQIMAWELHSDFVATADYLMDKGGFITCKNAASPWELEATQRNINDVATEIQYNDDLLKELQKRGVEAIMKQPQDSFAFIQSTLLQHQNSFERLCVSLIASKQIHPFLLLKQYLKSDMQESIKFVTPVNGIIKFMQSKEDQLIIIRSRNIPLTLTRLKITIYPDILTITSEDLNNELPDANLTVYHSKTAENDVIQILKNLNRKIICVFSIIHKEVEQHNQIHSDDIVWTDLSDDFQRSLILHAKVTSEISDLPLGSHQSSKPEELVDFICKNDHTKLEVLEIVNQHIAEYLNQNTSFEFLKFPQTAITNLHVAVRKGYPVITKFLLNLKNEAELQELKYLIHFCIVDSQYESEKQIACKERIIELLSKKNKHLVNERLPNGTLPLLQRNVHIRLVECLAKNGADYEKVLAFGKGLTVEVIKIMEDQGLQLTKELSSDTLMNLICNKQIMAWELDRNFIQVADYLIYKGARLLCKNGKSPWEKEAVQKNMSRISKSINHNEALQTELINRITNEMKQIAQSDCLHEKWESLQHKRSFERLCISLIACGQVEPYTLLKLCIQSDTNDVSKFITPSIGVAQLFLRKTCNVVVLKSLNMQVSTTRIQDTVDSDAVVFSEADLNTEFPLQHSFNLVILQCQTASVEMIKRLNELEHKVICLCNDVATELTNSQICEILVDEFTWGDFSADFQNELSQSLKCELGKTDDEISNLFKNYSFNKLMEMVAAVNDREVKLLKSEASTWLCNSTQEYFEAMQVSLKSCKSKQDFIADHEKCILEAIHNFNSKWSSSSKHNAVRGQFIKQLRDNIDTQFEKLLELLEFSKKRDSEKVALVKQEVRKYYHSEMKKHMKNRQFIQPQILRKLYERSIQTAIDNCRYAISLIESQKTILLQEVEKSYQKYEMENTMILKSKLGSEPAIGIDLGTSYCRIAVCYKGKITVIKNARRLKFTPSYVAFNPDGTHSVGKHAKGKVFQNPENTIYDIKRILGRSFQDDQLQNLMENWTFEVLCGKEGPVIKIYGKYYLPEQIAAILLKELVKQAGKIVEGKISKAVVTVPAYFTDEQRAATDDAAEMAGLEVLQILDEPIAAAMSYNLERHREDPSKVLIFDMGGCTLEISIVKMEGTRIEILNKVRDSNLGGIDFDKAMMEYCSKEFKKQHGLDPFKKEDFVCKPYQDAVKQRRCRLQSHCEQGKIVLDVSSSTVISVDAFYGRKDLEVIITRHIFEELNVVNFRKALEIVGTSLGQAGISKTQIDDFVLVGGSTRIPKVQQMLAAYFEKPLNLNTKPDEVVAYGAAVQAALINGRNALQ